MAASTSKDQPPAYTNHDDQAPIKPNYSKRASQLFHEMSQGNCTMSQYLELTFSVGVAWSYAYSPDIMPVVVAIDENYADFLRDNQHMLGSTTKRTAMKVHWEKKCWGGWVKKDHETASEVNDSNITAILRLLKSRNGVGCIRLS